MENFLVVRNRRTSGLEECGIDLKTWKLLTEPHFGFFRVMYIHLAARHTEIFCSTSPQTFLEPGLH